MYSNTKINVAIKAIINYKYIEKNKFCNRNLKTDTKLQHAIFILIFNWFKIDKITFKIMKYIRMIQIRLKYIIN